MRGKRRDGDEKSLARVAAVIIKHIMYIVLIV